MRKVKILCPYPNSMPLPAQLSPGKKWVPRPRGHGLRSTDFAPLSLPGVGFGSRGLAPVPATNTALLSVFLLFGDELHVNAFESDEIRYSPGSRIGGLGRTSRDPIPGRAQAVLPFLAIEDPG